MKIQISKIRFNPENPRHFINPDKIDSLAASMKADGQLEPVKVRKLTPQDTPSHGCTGTEPAEYELFEGERRLRAAMKLGWLEIEAEACTGTREDFSLKGFMDNNGEPYLWLDKYRYIANYRAKNPNLTQKQTADILDVASTMVSNADKVIPLLNDGAMAEIYRIAKLSTSWQVPERTVVTLSGLANGQKDVLNLMERAIKVAIQGKMTEKQAKKLAEWVKLGNSPETFGDSKQPAVDKALAGEGQDGPYATLWQELAETGYFQIKRPAKGGIHIIIADEDSGAVAALGAAGAIWGLGHKDSKLDENPYLVDLPGMVEKIKAGEVVSGKGDGLSESQIPNGAGGIPNSKSQMPNGPMTMVKGILNKQVTTASNDPIDQLKAKAINTGLSLAKKGAKKVWTYFKKKM
jgi:ParB/RepB/Spo0J family partition protein